MRQLVEDGVSAALVLVVGGLGAKDVLVADGHAAGVLHGAGVELRHEDLVILAKGISKAEVTVVKVEALLGFGKDALCVKVLC